jgi:hypothetical protein
MEPMTQLEIIIPPFRSSVEEEEDTERTNNRQRLRKDEQWEDTAVDQALLAISSPAHKEHIEEHLRASY